MSGIAHLAQGRPTGTMPRQPAAPAFDADKGSERNMTGWFRFLPAVLVGATLLAVQPARAGDFDFDGGTQQDFDAVVRDVTAALAWRALHPAETGGITGIELAVVASYAPTEEGAAWRATTGSDVDELGMIGLRAIKGLPLGFEVGALFSSIPGTGAELMGAELRYALLEGGVATPAISLRAAVTRLSGVDGFEFDSRSLDLSISKGFTLLTPYAGIGRVQGDARRDFLGTRQDSDHEATRVFAGLRIGLGLFDITPEYERAGDNSVFSLLLGLSI